MRKIQLFTAGIFVTMHIAAVAGIFFVPKTWHWLLLTWFMYAIRGFAVTVGYHRYFSHRSFETSRWFQFVIAFVATLALQRGPLWWASRHRHHHIHSDKPEDVHSPVQYGLLQSHIGWMIEQDTSMVVWGLVPDWEKYPELCWLDRNHAVINTVFPLTILLVGGWTSLYWGFILSTVALWHSTWLVNSACHIWGYRPYDDIPDTSRNNPLVAALAFGEGWHNNHHHDQKTARNGFKWWELDPSYWIIWSLGKVGLVKNIHEPRHLKNKTSANG